MPKDPSSAKPLVLICGDDDFSVKQRAKELFEQWSKEVSGFDHEIIDAAVQNSGEALSALAKTREALNTLPFFGGGKVVWLQNCTFLGDDRTSASSAVTEALGDFAELLKTFRWDGVRLLISAGKPDKRRSFFKTIEKIGSVETFTALSAEDRDWAAAAEAHALKLLRAGKKEIDDEALAELIARVGPNLRALASEVEKLVLYLGDREAVTVPDVQAVVARQKLARAFALAEALGERDLPKLLRTLDEELWEIRSGIDKRKSEIGLLYGLISKVRTLLLVKELRREGLLKPARDYNSFKSQIERMPASSLPPDKRFNPLAGNPYPAFQASKQSDHYETGELVEAMETLLEANRRLVSSGLDDALVLQQALVEIVGVRKRKAAAG
jgi:DNA polymerase-3 subunit delta